MFLKRFKNKSNQKYINNILNARVVNVNDNKLASVGVVLSIEEYANIDQMRKLMSAIGVKDNKVKFITFINDEKDKPNSWDAFFNPKEFGWSGKIENAEVKDFVVTKFDALISFYKQDNLELNLVTALSQANFKIGLSNKDERLHDFIIDVSPNNIDIFKNELIKYLKVLNKL